MRSSTVVRMTDYHAQDCDCAACEPYRPSRPRFHTAAIDTGLWMIAGLATGQLAVFAWDALTAGPGALAVFGL